MTLPSEERNSLELAEEFLMAICQKKLKRVSEIREAAVRILRHFPGKYRIGVLFDSEFELRELKTAIKKGDTDNKK